MRIGHTSTHPGKRVMVHLRNGEKVIGKFRKKEGNLIYLDGLDPIPTAKVRCLSHYRAQTR
jgi:hypothetical protein